MVVIGDGGILIYLEACVMVAAMKRFDDELAEK